ncbi:MAG: hypothetical protein H0T80_01230 [Betaproteobacteria bacterium]|nr:hypothetical protein [Betaproteobacteria bacterium]
MAALAHNRLLRVVPALLAVVALCGCATGFDSSGQRFYLPWSANQPLHPEWNLNFPRESLRLPASPRPDPLPERKRYDDQTDLSPYALLPSTLPAVSATQFSAKCVSQCNSSLETAIATARIDARDSRSVIRR